MSRLAVLCALVVSLLLGADVAEACSSPIHTVSRVLGFDAYGRFVQYDWHLSEASEELHDESFTLFDADGTELARLTLSSGAEGYFWKATGATYFGGTASLADGDAARIEKMLIETKKLTMPVKRRALRHVKSEAECGSVELETRDGWLRVAEAVSLRSIHGGCETFSLDGFEHPKAEFVFVRIRQRLGSGDDLRETDVVARLSKRRVEGITLAWRGERARLKGKVAEAISALEASIEAAPEYLPSRVGLVRAYARAGRKAAPAIAALLHPIPEERSFIGERPDDEVLTKLFRSWPTAKLPVTLPWSDPRRDWRHVAHTFD